jgi:3-(3-hydroxy-phenyl)propionate hydroxylase
LEFLSGNFELLWMMDTGARPHVPDGIKLTIVGEDLLDAEQLFAQRFDAAPGTSYLLRPDQHICARWRNYESSKIAAAHRRALGK